MDSMERDMVLKDVTKFMASVDKASPASPGVSEKVGAKKSPKSGKQKKVSVPEKEKVKPASAPLPKKGEQDPIAVPEKVEPAVPKEKGKTSLTPAMDQPVDSKVNSPEPDMSSYVSIYPSGELWADPVPVVEDVAVNACLGCMYIQVQISTLTVRALIDCGSCISLLARRVVDHTNLMSMVLEKQVDLIGVSGCKFPTHGVLKSYPLVVEGKHLLTSLHIADIAEECILGQDFLEEHHFTLDFGARTMKNGTQNLHLEAAVPRQANIPVKAATDLHIQGSYVMTCSVEEPNNIVDAVYVFTWNPLLDSIIEEKETLVWVQAGAVHLPMAIEDPDAELFLPEQFEIGTIRPVNAVSQVQTDEIYENDFDERRVAVILEQLKINSKLHLTEDQRQSLRDLARSHADIFALSRSELGRTDLVEHLIPLTTDKPVQAPYRRVPLHLRAESIRELEDLLAVGILEHSESNYNTPVLIIKRNDKLRLILDFRALNAVTERSLCTVPALNTITAGCSGAKFFSNLDLKDGYFQIPLKKEHKRFTAFCVPGIGYFQFTVMPLGLSGAPGTFQNLLDRLLAGVPPEVGSAFIDDILSPARSFEDSVGHLKVIFGRLKLAKLRLSPKKCNLAEERLKYCGVFLSAEGIEADAEKITAVKDMPLPRSIKDVRCLLGSYSWFRQHIPHFAELAKGLTDCLKGEKFLLTPPALDSITNLNQALCEPPILTFPDAHKPMVMYCDASEVGIGGALGHLLDDGFHVISYSSRVLNPTEQRWASFKRELFAVWYHITQRWRYYLIGAKFECHTDMKAITEPGFMKHCNQSIILRWLMDLASYEFDLVFTAGKNMELPDCLSRLPVNSEELFPWWTGETLTKSSMRIATMQTNTGALLPRKAGYTTQLMPLVKEGSFENPIPAARSEEMKQSQEEDPSLKVVFEWLREGKRPDSSEGMSADLQWAWRYFEHLGISEHGLLYYRYHLVQSDKFKALIVVPAARRNEVLRANHDLPSSGHLGPRKTLLRIRDKFYFRGLTDAVKAFCVTCAQCFVHNEPYRKNAAAPLKMFRSSRPNQYLAIDLVGPVKGAGHYKWILTMVCKFTRFVQAVPLTNATSEKIAAALTEKWIFLYGCPEAVLSDRGANLTTAHVIQEVYKVMGLKKLQTTAYHPKGNGQCESYNKHLVIVLRKLVNSAPREWYKSVAAAVFALNNSVCASTGYSPSFLWFGRSLRLPSDLMLGTTTTSYYATAAHLASTLYLKMEEVFDDVRAANARTLVRHKAVHDRRKGFHWTYKVGDRVLVLRPLAPSIKQHRKFKSGFTGPWIITRILSDWTFVVRREGSTNKEQVIHFDSMRLLSSDLSGRVILHNDPLDHESQDTNVSLPAPENQQNRPQNRAEKGKDQEEEDDLAQALLMMYRDEDEVKNQDINRLSGACDPALPDIEEADEEVPGGSNSPNDEDESEPEEEQPRADTPIAAPQQRYNFRPRPPRR